MSLFTWVLVAYFTPSALLVIGFVVAVSVDLALGAIRGLPLAANGMRQLDRGGTP
jgi:hypothetical protein